MTRKQPGPALLLAVAEGGLHAIAPIGKSSGPGGTDRPARRGGGALLAQQCSVSRATVFRELCSPLGVVRSSMWASRRRVLRENA